MIFHEHGDPKNRALMFIHGVLTPYTIWNKAAEYFKKDYFVVVPELSAHSPTEKTEFISLEHEAELIENYINEKLFGGIYGICGLSMGGAVADKLLTRGNVKIHALLLDGAPLVKTSKLSERVMTSSYLKIIEKSKKRDPKVIESFKKDFLPEEFLEDYLKLADNMSPESMRAIVAAACSGRHDFCFNDNLTRILFLHGTKGNEVLAKKSAKLLQKNYPDMDIIEFKGLAHAELATRRPEEWVKTAEKFFSNIEKAHRT